MDINTLISDIAAFADDSEEVVADPNGDIMFRRGGEDIECKLVRASNETLAVQIGDEQFSYTKFISHFLGRLDVLAERLAAKRHGVPAFVDGPVHVDSAVFDPIDTTGLEGLSRECAEVSPFAARVVFVTGDAGHGKTALLREYQSRTATKFLEGKCPFVFWHVDLQGRQLLRLSEALMGDLGELRVQGLFYPSIVTLLRYHCLVLAIDGFDELAAEQGSAEALGALAHLLKSLDSKGVVVAASRRTFFDTEDYVKRSSMLRQTAATQCEIDQIKVLDWGEKEAVEYLTHVTVDSERFAHPEATYNELVTELGGDTAHPLVSRPFLLAQTVRALLRYSMTPKKFIRGMENPLESVAEVVKAFVDREVQEKWRFKETGEPYLTSSQHMRLLAEVAEEMWIAQKDRLDAEVVELISVSLLDEWRIDEGLRRQITDMVRMHVLLTIPPDAPANVRGFDHPEFRNYFLARAFYAAIDRAIMRGEPSRLGRLLAVGQLPDSVGHYLTSLVARDESTVRKIVDCLIEQVARAWRPTYLQTNVGTLIPFMIDGVPFEGGIRIGGKIIYSSIVFKGTRLEDVSFVDGLLNMVHLSDVRWKNVRFENCEVSEFVVDMDAKFENVSFIDCRLGGLVLMDKDEERQREYAPNRIAEAVRPLGIDIRQAGIDVGERAAEPTAAEAALQRLLRLFTRTTGVSENILRMRFKRDLQLLERQIIPLMERHKLIQSEKWVGSGKQRRWTLTRRVDDILRGADDDGDEATRAFWKELRTAAE